jgi:O-methyltransferase involved in polyketide biosynthesis
MFELHLIPDSSLLSAACRAHETRRTDHLVDDPFAAGLSGARGEDLYAAYPADEILSAILCLSIAIVDDLLLHAVVDYHIHTVADLVPGLDPRPYRLGLPSDLRWVEVDLDSVHAYEALRLANATPHCQVRRVGADLSTSDGRVRATHEIAKDVTHGLVLTGTGFHDLPRGAVDDLLARVGGAFKLWILAGPARFVWPKLAAATSASPEEAPASSMDELLAMFERRGWQPVEYRALEEEALRLAPRRVMPLRQVGGEDHSHAGVWLLRHQVAINGERPPGSL